MNNEILVSAQNVGKRFCRSLKRSLLYGLQDLGSEIRGQRHGGNNRIPSSSQDVSLRQDEFWAVQDISFQLRRGECLGLIGHNGAGKTTLLRMLNGLIKPDTGRIEMRGNIGALIALGAGFNPILTGRENILISASVMGLTEKETLNKMDEIIDFAELDDFIDSPVQTYSSGMQVRLGFSIATSIQHDILILDEVLAVGDGNFVSKCYNRIDQLRKEAAVIFVSHHLPHVGRMCSHALFLNRGKLEHYSSEVNDVIKAYREHGSNKVLSKDKSKMRQLAFFDPINAFDFLISSYKLDSRESFTIKLTLELSRSLSNFFVTLDAKNEFGEFISSLKISSSEFNITLGAGTSSLNITVDSLPLRSGNYLLTLGLLNYDGSVVAIDRDFASINLNSQYADTTSASQFYATLHNA